jgi:DNA-binding HxlR family transcriptional regulator
LSYFKTEGHPATVEPNGPKNRGHDPALATWATAGDRWTLLILREVYFGVHRYSDIRRNLAIARTPLSDRLSRLVDAGIMERVQYQRKPVRLEYRLTERGLDLFPVIVALFRFGERWVPTPDSIELRHHGCGGAVVVNAHCADCGQPVTAHDTDYLR